MKKNNKKRNKVKEKVKKWVKYKCRRCRARYKRWCKYQFISSSKLLYWTSLILISIEIADEAGRVILPEWLGKVTIIIACILLGVVIRLLIDWLSSFIFKVSIDEFISAIMILTAMISSFNYFGFRLSNLPDIAIGIFLGLLFILFLKSLWSLVKGKRRTIFNFSVVCLGIGVIGLGVYFINSKGFEDNSIKTYLELQQKDPTLSAEKANDFIRAIKGGNFTPQSLIYSPEETSDIKSTTVNLKSYATNNKGLSGYIKKKYQGYDLDAVPLRGKVWYPLEAQNCPTLFIIHGNHDYLEDSYLGYDYLGEYLSTYGYVVISIDQNACNLLSNENDARAILLLENIKAVEQFSQDKESPIYHKIDMNALAIAGHSRGGEAVSIAYLFNNQAVSLNNGLTKWNYHFNIRSIIAIAPTIDQYKPIGKSVKLKDVNYMVIHGANDSDLYQFGGMKQYKNIEFTGQNRYIKTSLYCAGCNHGQFNTRWGLYDRTGGHQKVLNVKDMISESKQQEIAKTFIKIFLDCTLKQDESHIKLLEDYRIYTKYLPSTLYIQSYQKSDFVPICNFEEDLSLSTGTMAGVIIDVKGGNVWTEGLYPVEAERSNSSIYVSWNNGNKSSVVITMPAVDMTNRALQFDIMNLQEDFKEPKLLEAQIILKDENQKSVTLLLSDYATIYPAFLVRLNKLQYLLNEVEYKHQFQTVTIPINELNLGKIVELTIAFTDDTGRVAIDEIGC